MSTAVAKTATHQPTKLDRVMGEILAPSRKQQIIDSLPAHIPYQRFERNLANALMNEPRLLDCDPGMVFREVMKVAQLGLLLDPQLGEAWLIVGYGKRGPEPQRRVGYRGLLKLMRQSGYFKTAFARAVHENDVLEVDLAQNTIHHKPDLKADRGAIVGYYAIAKDVETGEPELEWMSIAEIHEIRDRFSDGWKAFKANKIRSTPWDTSEGEQSKKTVLRRLLKRLPQSPDITETLSLEDRAASARVVGEAHVSDAPVNASALLEQARAEPDDDQAERMDADLAHAHAEDPEASEPLHAPYGDDGDEPRDLLGDPIREDWRVAFDGTEAEYLGELSAGIARAIEAGALKQFEADNANEWATIRDDDVGDPKLWKEVEKLLDAARKEAARG